VKPKWPALAGRHSLLIIILLGVGVRIGAALYQGNSVTSLPGVFDQISYHKLAVRVLGGHGFSFETGWWPATPANQPTAHWSFLYTLFLSATYFAFGINPLVARVIQCILTGVLQPLLAWRIGGRLFGPRVGLVSAALTAFYGYFVYYSAALVTESFYILAILWILDISTVLAASSNHPGGLKQLRPWVYLGLASGVAVLLRQVFLLIVPVVLAWICWRSICQHQSESGSWKKLVIPLLHRLVLVSTLLVASILPCTIRNYLAFGQFVLVNTNAGFAFFWGNHPSHGTQFIPILPGDGSRYGVLIPDELRTLNEAHMDRALLRRGIAFVLNDPTRYVLLSISRAGEYFKFWPSQDSGAPSNLVRVLSFGLCLPFLLSGVLIALFHTLCREQNIEPHSRPAAVLLLLVSGIYGLIHLLTWTLVRYRLPIDAILMPFAALSMVSAYGWVSRSVRSAPIPLHSSAE
jgi:Dolichyl-phosphate-mannose-protein mannosyltransferase